MARLVLPSVVIKVMLNPYKHVDWTNFRSLTLSQIKMFNCVFLVMISGKTYMFRFSNVGLSTSLNFRIQGHKLKLVECEGSHTQQSIYDSLDVHVGQSISVLVTLNQPPKDYYIVASTRFTRRVLTATAVLHYSNSHTSVSGPVPAGLTYQLHWSMQQARSFRYTKIQTK